MTDPKLERFAAYTTPETFARIQSYPTLAEMWESCLSQYGDSPAVVDGETLSFTALEERAARVRRALAEKGVKKGDRVGLYLPNCADFAVFFLGAATAGCVAVLLPPHLPAEAVLGCTAGFSLKALLSCEPMLPNSALAAEKTGVPVLTAASLPEQGAPMAKLSPEDPATVLFTGGTTGKSKAALLSHRALMAGVRNGCYGIHDIFGQRYLLVLPLTHVFGLIRNLLSSLYTGSSIFITRNNKDMFRDIAAFRPTVMVMVPALAEMALNLSKQFGRNMLGDDLKTIVCGAAVVPPYLIREYDKLGIALLAGYGLTESANLVSGNPESLKKPSSVGLPYPGQELKIVDGELWLRGENIMDGYLDPEANKQTFCDGWLRTGDLVRFDEEGFLYITGRIKEVLVLPSGEKVSPAELETLFNTIEAVQDSLVYVDSHGVLSLQVVPRQVVLKAQGIADPEAHIRAEVEKINAGLPGFERVSKIIVRDADFERSPSMKILREKNAQSDHS